MTHKVKFRAVKTLGGPGLLVLTLAVGACGSPMAPSRGPTLPIVLSGQSNAVMLEPYLTAAYPLRVMTLAFGGRPISEWNDGAGNWLGLIPMLQQPIQAFVWWQGESDRENMRYLSDLRDLMARVRQANNNPRLFVVEIRILNLPENAAVRAAQEAFVAADVNAALVSTDGFQLGGSDHLTDAGYRFVANRVVELATSNR